jgi:putative lipoic acid-binding regulatory protein
MYKLPALELLEETHTFPGPYMFKVIGKAEGDLIARTVATVRLELGLDSDPPFRVRESSGGKHLAITLEPFVTSAAQVLAVYQRLSATQGITLLW